MLGSIRKFSSSIYAKILLGIIIIPFVFWGMGSSFTGGNKNIVVVIDKEKYSVQEFGDFIRRTAQEEVKSNQVEKFLSSFIGEKLIEKEVENFQIKLSDESLGKLIKHQKNFKRNNEFSRTEYEKFLLKNNLTAGSFEYLLSKEEKKKQLLDFIGGGIKPSEFLINLSYDKINQKRSIELLNLNKVFETKLNFSENEMKNYFDQNKNKYIEKYKTIKLLELNPKNLIDSDEFSDLFFKKIDEIDDLIISGENLDFIMQKYNLEKSKTFTFDKSGKDINYNKVNEISEKVIKNIFSLVDAESTALIEDKNKYLIVELFKTENVERNLKNERVKKEVLSNLEKEVKRKLITEIILKINQNNFTKSEFNKLSNDKNLPIEKISFKNRNDEEKLKKEIVNKIYAAPEKKVIVIHDLNLTENFLIYVNKVENVTINDKSDEYKKYLNVSRKKITNELLNTYDAYIKKKYEIDINYKALDVVKNYFN